MRMQAFHLSSQGASHIKKNKECQDASESFYSENCAIAIVCDGHGGDDYVRSASGSAFACAVAKANILNFIENVNKDELIRHHQQLIHKLEASIISAWNEAVYAHYESHPFTESEIAVLSERAKRKYLHEKRIESAYGTTLIAVACTENYWFGIHIGDGKCVAVNPKGKFVQPIPWDEKCFLNATTSICDSDALNRFRSFFSEKLPVAVFVGSDGIDDCFSTEEQLNNLYKTVLYSFASSDFDSAVTDLSDYLPRLSAKGSGDDVSIAAVLDLDKIGEIDAVREFDKDKEKARIEENARIAAEKLEEERKRVEAEQLHRQQTQRAVSPKYCSYCGTKLVPGMKFCGECGTRIIPENAGNAPTATQQNTGLASEELKIIKIVPFGNEPSTAPADAEQTAEEKVESDNTDNTEAQDLSVASVEMQDSVPDAPVESAATEQELVVAVASENSEATEEVTPCAEQEDAEKNNATEASTDASDTQLQTEI